MRSAETPDANPDHQNWEGTGSPADSASVGPAQSAVPDGVEICLDRRRYQRVDLRLFGRFMRANKREYPCEVLNISPGGMTLRAPIKGEQGERIVAYVDDLGRIEGELTRIFQDGFAVRFIASQYKRDKLANKLTFLANRGPLDLAENRRHSRSVPRRPHTQLALGDGTVIDCKVLDVSLSGASIAVQPKPEVGTRVTIGLMRGEVVRHHELGIGVEFSDIQNPNAISRHFA